MTTTSQHDRHHALDQLRAIAMLAGVLFHASLAHSSLMQPFWPGAMGATSPVVDALAWLSHLVRMPLFFLVSGYFTASLLDRRGMEGLFRQRLRRILVPFLVAWPVLTLSFSFGLSWAAENVHASNSVLSFLRSASESDIRAMPLTLGHLWFLPYILLFSVLVWVGRTLALGWMLDAAMKKRSAIVIALLPLVLVAPFAMTSAPHPAPESLFPQFWAIGLYGPFFALGYGLFGRLSWLERLPLGWFSAGVVVAYSVFFWRLFAGPSEDLWPRAAIAIAISQAVVAAWGTILALSVGIKFLNRPSRTLSYLARGSYTTYLVHLPLVIALQISLLGIEAPLLIKFFIVVSGSLAGSLLFYEFIVRRTFLRQWIG